MKSELTYVSGATILPEGAFGVSPSQLATFFTSPTTWYNEQVIGNRAEFTGNTSSYIGTCVHFIAESYTKKGEYDVAEIYKYLFLELCSDQSIVPDFTDSAEAEGFLLENADKEGVDIATILERFPIMGDELVSYLDRVGKPSHSEDLIKAEIQPGYFVSGSCDALSGAFTYFVWEE